MWMNILFVGGTCGIIDFFIICVEHIFFPSLTKKLELLVNQGVNLDRNNTKDMPKIVREKLAYYNEFQSNDELDKITERIQEENLNNEHENNIIKIENDQIDNEGPNNMDIMDKKNQNLNKKINISKKDKRNLITIENDSRNKNVNNNNNNEEKEKIKEEEKTKKSEIIL